MQGRNVSLTLPCTSDALKGEGSDPPDLGNSLVHRRACVRQLDGNSKQVQQHLVAAFPFPF